LHAITLRMGLVTASFFFFPPSNNGFYDVAFTPRPKWTPNKQTLSVLDMHMGSAA